jgi:PTS system nitrogen regulatory IIA component
MSEFEDCLRACMVRRNLCGADRVAVLDDLIAALVAGSALAPDCREDALQAVLRREANMTTATADGVAFPHARIEAAAPLVPVIGIHRAGVDFGAPDGVRTHVFVLMLVTPPFAGSYLRLLAGFARQLGVPAVRSRLLEAADEDAVRQVLRG